MILNYRPRRNEMIATSAPTTARLKTINPNGTREAATVLSVKLKFSIGAGGVKVGKRVGV